MVLVVSSSTLVLFNDISKGYLFSFANFRFIVKFNAKIYVKSNSKSILQSVIPHIIFGVFLISTLKFSTKIHNITRKAFILILYLSCKHNESYMWSLSHTFYRFYYKVLSEIIAPIFLKVYPFENMFCKSLRFSSVIIWLLKN